MNDITVTTAGRAYADAELRYTPNGKAVASVRIAVQHRKKQGTEWVDAGTTWLDCQAWDKLAENMAESIKKGDRVLVTGRLVSEEWTGREGDKRATQRVTVDDLGLSLRWDAATAKRSERAQQPASKQQADPWATAGAAGEAPF